MLRIIAVCLVATGMTAGCANLQPVTSGGYYCITGTQVSCPEHEGYGDCQLCPKASMTANNDPRSLW
jgi:hypothetical protein